MRLGASLDALSPSMPQLSGISVLLLGMEQGRVPESLASDQKHGASRAEASRPPTAYPPARLPELETTGNNLNTASRSKALTREQHQVSGLYETPTRQYRINTYRERKLIPQKRLKSRTKSEYPAELLKRLCFRSH